jgi:2-polyprenyl-3-methyl-5-hydroxy-6-metoxy-1,4-benzoquinol methylase
MNSNYVCRICRNSSSNTEIILREWMFNTGAEFPYFTCSGCGCLQICNVPSDIGRYYPADYYSIFTPPRISLRQRIRRAVKRNMIKHLANRHSPLGPILNALPFRPQDAAWLRVATPAANLRILDVGCGNGERLSDLHSAGFSRLTGLDPFIRQERTMDADCRILKAELHDLDGSFDLITFHHSLEHMPEPVAALREAARLLAPSGRILIRVPVMDKWAWRQYGTNWIQLDPPRHLYTFSEASLHKLAVSSSLQVTEIVYDSTTFQFEGSDAVMRSSAAARNETAERTQTTDMSRSAMRRLADRLNRERDGDQACFFLSRPAP